MKRIVLSAIIAFVCSYSNAQCPAGEVEVTVTVKTDGYGGEGYWELVPSGNACGTGTIFAGGNNNVGCNGAGAQASPPGGYPDDSTFTEGPWCLTQGSSFDIIFVDDWMDGGLTFTVNINGYPLYANMTGSGAPGTVFTFIAVPPPATDLGCRVIKTPSYVPNGNVYPKAWIVNLGMDTVHSFDYYFSVDNSPAQISNISGITLDPFDSTLVTAINPWVVSTTGDFQLRIGASGPNGNQDLNAANDTAQRTVASGPPVPNIIDDYLTSNTLKTVIGDASDDVDFPTDLDFHPVLTRYELWVTLRGTTFGGGSTVKFTDAGMPTQTSLKQTDGNAGHFMDLPSALAFSENENFATSPAVYDANHSGGAPFTGPTLWSSDSTIYCHTPPGGNGSHLDMLHQSPYAMGICSEEENIFWVFDDNDHDIVRYDFKKDHGPGQSDHSDGVARRFTGMNLAGDPNHTIGSHLVLDKESGLLYISDTHNNRILRMNINTGTFDMNLIPYESMAEYSSWSGMTWNIIADSALNNPSGIDLIEDRLIVSEYNTGDIIVYDVSGNSAMELGRISTGAQGIMGVKIGPDGKIWYVNSLTDEVVRLDQVPTNILGVTSLGMAFYPNPATETLNILFGNIHSSGTLTVYDSKGAVVLNNEIAQGDKKISIDISSLPPGVYSVYAKTTADVVTKKFVKQ
jgi:hypothetical protein